MGSNILRSAHLSVCEHHSLPLSMATFWDIPGMKAGAITGDVAWNLLKHAKENKYAIPAFNCTGSSVCNAVLEAGAKIGRPIMIQFSEGGSAFFCGKGLPNGKKRSF